MIILYILLAVCAVIAVYLLKNARETRRMAAKVTAANPMRGQTLQISTGRLHYVDRGTGPAIVMVHGLGGNLGHFDMGVIDDLAKDHRVIAIDRPGMGYSDRPEDKPAGLRAQAGYVAEVIDKLGLDRPLLVGHSLGGGISLAFAVDHPEKTRGLALLAPLTRQAGDPSPAFAALGITNAAVRRFVANTLAVPASIKKQQETIDLVFGPDAVPDGYSVQGGGLLGLRPASFLNASRDYVHALDDLAAMEAGYDNIRVPVALLYGTEDRILDHQAQGVALCAKHPAFTVELIEGAGHMLPVTHSAKTIAFIRGVDAASA